MKSFEELHIHHGDVSSEIRFLKKEIEFLLKMLGNCYSTSIKLEKMKLQDAYWKGFEQKIAKLDILLKKINIEEPAIEVPSNDVQIYLEEIKFNEDYAILELREIEREVKVLKESFYEFMQGCNACALKN